MFNKIDLRHVIQVFDEKLIAIKFRTGSIFIHIKTKLHTLYKICNASVILRAGSRFIIKPL